ncbi:hypothetical protein NE237_007556 [Protea cynaroides]|uniref:DUF4283 domain-containing protein n=1 Tax=Protea cynaroides TaxID=273540 RepID=A0A9Q0QWI3_9MAGN|nr:hypothetical protein NE237_007556 [Protea cynaroides]
MGICTKEAIEREVEDLKNTAVGFFLGQRPRFSLIKSSLTKQWKGRMVGSVIVFLFAYGGFEFDFSDPSDRDRIVQMGKFFIGGRTIFIRKWVRTIHEGTMGLKNMAQ